MKTSNLLLILAGCVLVLLCNDAHITIINFMNDAPIDEHTTIFSHNAKIDKLVQLNVENHDSPTDDKQKLSAATINLMIDVEKYPDSLMVLDDYIKKKKVIEDANIDAHTLSDVLRVLIVDRLIQKYNVNLNNIEYSRDGIPLKDKLDSFYEHLSVDKNVNFNRNEHKVYVYHTTVAQNDDQQIILNSKFIIPSAVVIGLITALYQIPNPAVLLCNCLQMDMNKMLNYNQIILDLAIGENGKLLVSNDVVFDKNRTIYHYLMFVTCFITPNHRRIASNKLIKAQQNANMRDLMHQDIYGNTPLHYVVFGYAFSLLKKTKNVKDISDFLTKSNDWSQLSWKWERIQNLMNTYHLIPNFRIKNSKFKGIECMDKNAFLDNIKSIFRPYRNSEIHQLIVVNNNDNRTAVDVLRQIFDEYNIRNDPLMEYLLSPKFNPMLFEPIKRVLRDDSLSQRPLITNKSRRISNNSMEYKICSDYYCEQREFPLEFSGAICKLCTEQKIWFCSRQCLQKHLETVHKKFKKNAS